MKMEEKRKEVSIREACEITQKSVLKVKETETVALEDSCGRVAAEDIIAGFDQPPFDRSPLDGFAVYSGDVADASPESPAELMLADEIWAGGVPSVRLERGQAVRILTGAPIPEGSDCVIKQEDTEIVSGAEAAAEGCGETCKKVRIFRGVKSFQNYCFSGEDFRKGQKVIRKGTTLEFTDIGRLASFGITHVQVFRKPRVAVIVTGDEVILPGQPLSPGKIYNSNLFMIRAGILSCGGEISYCVQSEDSPDHIGEHLLKAVKTADLVITTGGVSVGKRDYLPQVLRRLGAQILFQKILIKPGAPTTFSLLYGKPVLSLSGNPSGAAVNFILLGRPMIGAAARNSSVCLRYERAVFQGNFAKESPRTRYVRGILSRDGNVRLKPERNGRDRRFTSEKNEEMQMTERIDEDPSDFSEKDERNCYIEIPAGTKCLKGGELLRVICI